MFRLVIILIIFILVNSIDLPSSYIDLNKMFNSNKEKLEEVDKDLLLWENEKQKYIQQKFDIDCGLSKDEIQQSIKFLRNKNYWFLNKCNDIERQLDIIEDEIDRLEKSRRNVNHILLLVENKIREYQFLPTPNGN